VTGCGRGQLTGDSLLLHATSRCPYMTHLDTSWTDVNTAGVNAASDNCQRSLLLTHSRRARVTFNDLDLSLSTGTFFNNYQNLTGRVS